ncbi:MAG: glutamine amidotransferase [Rhodanobacter sp.]
MKPILIIRTGHAPDTIRARFGDFPLWFQRAAKLSAQRVRVINVAAGEALPAIEDAAGAIITGSGAMVTERLPWSENTAAWIREAVNDELPLFGVCYGHQLMAHALGGRVDYLPGGREVGTQAISPLPTTQSDTLAEPAASPFRAHTTHEQSVLEPPTGAITLARSAQDAHQILRYGPHAISTQFHPEFSADIMRAYIRHKFAKCWDQAAQEAFRAVAPAPDARQVLQRFARQHAWTSEGR